MATFEICTATNGQYYFHLRATGDRHILLRSELYMAKSSCRNGIDSVKKNAPDDTRYDRLTAKNGQYYFNLKAANGEVIGTSSMYDTVSGRNRDIQLVMTQAPLAETIDLS